MSAYNGRRGPNVSAYVANLNTIAPEEIHEPTKLDADFSIFLDTEYFDQHDAGNNVNLNSPLDLNLNMDAPVPNHDSHVLPAAGASEPIMDFDLNGTCLPLLLHLVADGLAPVVEVDACRAALQTPHTRLANHYPTHPASSQPLKGTQTHTLHVSRNTRSGDARHQPTTPPCTLLHALPAFYTTS